jgi:ABC-type transporter Mla MlaB component
VKIERYSQANRTTIHLIGDFQSDHIAELRKQVEHDGGEITLDLSEIGLVDVHVVRFLAECVAKGIKIMHCPRYVKKWLLREREI